MPLGEKVIQRVKTVAECRSVCAVQRGNLINEVCQFGQHSYRSRWLGCPPAIGCGRELFWRRVYRGLLKGACSARLPRRPRSEGRKGETMKVRQARPGEIADSLRSHPPQSPQVPSSVGERDGLPHVTLILLLQLVDEIEQCPLVAWIFDPVRKPKWREHDRGCGGLG